MPMDERQTVLKNLNIILRYFVLVCDLFHENMQNLGLETYCKECDVLTPETQQ